MKQQEHDAFARQSIFRVSLGKGICSWCGQKRNRVYAYYVQSDGIGAHKNRISGEFCNKNCRKDYHR